MQVTAKPTYSFVSVETISENQNNIDINLILKREPNHPVHVSLLFALAGLQYICGKGDRYTVIFDPK